MINYSSLTELKTYLGISGTSEDTRLTQFLTSSYYTLNSLLGVDTLNQDTKTEVVEKIYSDGTLYLHNFPVTTILTIDGTSYTGALDTDYQIINKRRVTIKDISNYMTSLEFNNVKFTYTSGYDRDETGTTQGPNDELPEEIKLLQQMIIGGMRSKAGNEGISEYRLGEETIKYGSSTQLVQNQDLPTFKSILAKYQIKDVYSV